MQPWVVRDSHMAILHELGLTKKKNLMEEKSWRNRNKFDENVRDF